MTISVVIPAYNSAATLAAAIDSALSQTRPPDEIIVLDDGSTDNTKELVSGYGERIRYFYQPNGGLAAARNRGTELASGDWVAYLDADDMWRPDKLALQERQVQARPEAALVYTNATVLGLDGEGEIYADPETIWPELRCRNLFAASSTMAHRQKLMELGGFNPKLRVCEDWDMWVRLRRLYPFTAVPEPVTIYRQTQGSLSSNAERMLAGAASIRESTLLAGLSSWRKPLWRRRIDATQFMHAAEMVRESGRRLERAYLLRSLKAWPLPTLCARRYLSLARNLLGMRIYKSVARLFSSPSGTRTADSAGTR